MRQLPASLPNHLAVFAGSQPSSVGIDGFKRVPLQNHAFATESERELSYAYRQSHGIDCHLSGVNRRVSRTRSSRRFTVSSTGRQTFLRTESS